MTFNLRDVPGWTNKVLCVPTALSAISGLTPEEVVKYLVTTANRRGAPAQDDVGAAFNILDWLQVVRDLGGSYSVEKQYDHAPYEKR